MLSTGWRRRAERLLDIPSPFSRWWATGVAELGRAHGSDVDLIYGALVPYESAEATARLAREIGKPWIADLQDPWALDEMWIYPSGVHRCRDLGRMRRILNSADAVIMNTPEATERVLKRFPEPRRRIVVSIPNGFDRADFVWPGHTPCRCCVQNRSHRLSAHGTRPAAPPYGASAPRSPRRSHPGCRHPHPLTRISSRGITAPNCRATAPERSDRTPFGRRTLSRGQGDRCEVSVRSSDGYLAHDESLALVRSADLLLLPMQDLPAGTRAGLVPGKTYEYLASGRPILAAVPEGDARIYSKRLGTP